MVHTDIFATRERQEILEWGGIRFAVNDELNFCFHSERDKVTAEKIMRNALVL